MINYLYWLSILFFASGALYIIGHMNDEWKVASIVAAAIFLIGFMAYYFHFQQVFVKRYGGHMSITVPEGEVHISSDLERR